MILSHSSRCCGWDWNINSSEYNSTVLGTSASISSITLMKYYRGKQENKWVYPCNIWLIHIRFGQCISSRMQQVCRTHGYTSRAILKSGLLIRERIIRRKQIVIAVQTGFPIRFSIRRLKLWLIIIVLFQSPLCKYCDSDLHRLQPVFPHIVWIIFPLGTIKHMQSRKYHQINKERT
jgi:hypothetical protein